MATDHLVLRRAIQGDERALQSLWSQHSPHIDAVVRRLVGDADLAADIAQEVWIQIFRALPTYRGDSQFGTWAHRIAVNSALHGKRWRARRVTNEIPLPVTVPYGGAVDQPVLRLTIERALEKIPEGMRQVLVLHDVEGYTHEEIARLTGRAEGTCKTLLHRARKTLKEKLRA